MNKVYKVIWSKVKNCYVVVSELAKTHTKAPANRGINKIIIAGVLACILSYGIVLPVYAGNNNAVAGGYVNTSQDDNLAVGGGVRVESGNSIGIGENFTVDNPDGGDGNIGIMTVYNSVTDWANNSGVHGQQMVGIGHNSYASGGWNVSVGAQTYITGMGSVALGANTYVTGVGNVAIGGRSVANSSDVGDYVVSFGYKAGDSYIDYPGDGTGNRYVRVTTDSMTRRLINVADGIDDHDVSTVGQLNNRTKFVSINGASTDGNYLGDGATGTNAIAIGKDALASGNQSISVGIGNQVAGSNSGAFGDPNIVNGDNSYIVGNNSTVHANIKNAFVLGNNTSVSNGLPANWDSMTDAEKEAWANSLETTDVKEGVVALGNNISVSLDNKSPNSRSSTSAGTPEIEHVVAVGDNVVIGEENAIGIGHFATANALNTVAMGDDAQATMEGAIAVGHSSRATNSFSNALGYLAQATGEGAGAFGQDAQATGNFTVAFGRGTRATAESATAVGNNSKAISQSSIAIGTSAIANGGANTNAVAIGRSATIGSATQGYGETLAVGSGTNVQNTFGSALGSSANVTGQKGTAVGYNASVTASNAIALGADSVANVADTVSVGSASATRKIVNVTTGSADTDASTVGQTGSDLAIDGTTLQLKNANGTVLDSVTLPTSGGSSDVPLPFSGMSDVTGTGHAMVQLTEDKGLDYIGGWHYGTHGDLWFGSDDEKVSVFLDGELYQKEGTYKVLDESNLGGVVASDNTGLVNGGTVYNESRPAANGNYILTSNTAGANLVALDNQVKANADAISNIVNNGASTPYVGINSNGGTNITGEGAVGANTIAIGRDASALQQGSIALGHNASSRGANIITPSDTTTYIGHSVAIGTNSSADAYHSIAIGTSSSALYNGSLAIGSASYVDADAGGISTAVGYRSRAKGQNTSAFGTATYATGDKSVALGSESIANEDNVVSVGYKSGDVRILHKTTGTDFETTTVDTDLFRRIVNVADGTDANDAVTKGQLDAATAYYGVNSTGGTNVDGSGAIGSDAIAIGKNTSAGATAGSGGGGVGDIAIGVDSVADKGLSIAIGRSARATSHNSIGIGYDVNNINNYGHTYSTIGEASLAMGSGAIATSKGAFALGNDAVAAHQNSLALGNYTVTNAENTVSFGHDATDIDWHGNEYGSELKRKLVHVADGTDDSDAATVGQLNSSVEELSERTAYYGVNSTGGTNVDGSGAVGDNAIAIGKSASSSYDSAMALGNNAVADGNHTIALGFNSKASGYESIAIRGVAGINGSTVTYEDVAIGSGSKAYGGRASAIGTSAQATSYEATAVGYNAYANVQNSAALGTYTRAMGNSSVATGFNTAAEKANSVALGSQSIASEEGVVSVGYKIGDNSYLSSGATPNVPYGTKTTNLFRRIVNVANGLSANEAATVGQIRTVSAGNGIQLTETDNTNGSKNEAIAVKAGDKISVDANGVNVVVDGTVAENDEGLVTGGAVYTAINTEKTARENADTALEDRIDSEITDRQAADTALGTRISNETLARENADTELSNRIGTIDSNKNYILANANVSDNLVSLDAQIKENTDAITSISEGSVMYDNATTKETVTLGGDNGTLITNVKAGTLSETSKDAVNGSQLYSTNQALAQEVTDRQTAVSNEATARETADTALSNRIGTISEDKNYIKKSATNNVSENLIALDTQLKTTTSNLNAEITARTNAISAEATTRQNADNALSNRIGRLDTNGNYITTDNNVLQNVSALDEKIGSADSASGNFTNSTNTVNQNIKALDTQLTALGNDVQDLVDGLSDDIGEQLATKANISLNNINDDGRTVIRNIAKDSVKLEDGDNTTVSSVTDANGNITYKVHTLTDATKANLSLDNITDEGETVIRNIAKNSVKLEDGENTTVSSTVDADGNVNYKVKANADGTVAFGNTGIVTGGAVYDAITDAISDTTASYDDALANKADKNFGNITNDAKEVIKTEAKSVINVTGGNYATVDKTNVNGVDTYTVNVATDGSVSNGNDKLVTGGTVYTALDTLKSELENDTSTALADKANVSLDNITTNGVNVIKSRAKEAVNVSGNSDIAVTKENVNNVDTYKLSVNKNGSVVSGNTGIVTGGTVYTAINSAITNSEAGIRDELDNKANKTLDNITDEGRTVIKNLAKGSVDVVGGDHASVDKTDVNGVDTYTVNVESDGTVTSGDSKLVTGDTVYTAIENAKTEVTGNLGTLANDGNYIRKNYTVSENLVALDNQVKLNRDDIDDEVITRQAADTALDVRIGTLDANGNYISKNDSLSTNISALDTALKSVSDTVDTHTQEINNLKDLSTLTDSGKEVIRNISQNSVKVVNGTHTTVTEQTDGETKSYAVNVTTNGRVAEFNEGIVTGGTVYSAIQENATATATALDDKADKDLGNITDDGKEVIMENAQNAVSVTGKNVNDVTVGTSMVSGVKTFEIELTKNGAVADGNEGVVTGGTVYTAITNAIADSEANINDALDGKANDSLDNITDDGKEVIRENAKGAVNLTGNSDVTITKSDVNGVDTYNVSLTKDGVVSEGNTGVVTGGTVHSAITTAISNSEAGINDALDDKANVGLDNISDAGKEVIKSNAKGAVNVVGGNYATVEKSDVNGVDTYTVNVDTDGAVADGNEKLVTGGTVYTAIETAKSELGSSLDDTKNDILNVVDTKADKDLGNITDDGKNVIKGLAKGSVNVVNGINTTVTTTEVDGVKTFAVNAEGNGVVEEGNTGLVSGGTLYTALETVKSDTQTGLDSKADNDLSNLTDDGENKVKELAQDAILINGSDDVSVTKQHNDTTNQDEYTIVYTPTGTISENETKAVSGDTLYRELNVSDGNYIENSKTTGENISMLDTKLKEVETAVSNAETVLANTVSYDNADKTSVTFAGVNGTKLTNLQDADVSETSTDAVTGRQLHEVKTDVAGLDTRLTDAENNISTLQGDVTTLTNRVDEHDTAINNLNDSVTNMQQDITNIQNDVQNNKDAIDGLDGRVTVLENNASDVNDRLDGIDTSINTINNTINDIDGRVTNNETAIQNLSDSVDTRLAGKADTDLGNITEEGKDVVRDLAKGIVKDVVDMADGEHTNITKVIDGDKVTYKVNVKTDGTITEGDERIVTGGTVYNTVHQIEENISNIEQNMTNIHYVSVNASEKDDDTYDNQGASGADAVAIGVGSKATGNKSLAIGTGNVVSGDRSGAIGDPNTVTGNDSYAVGNDNNVSGDKTFVLGNNVTAIGKNSVVLGDNSDGSRDNVVSVGSAGNERKIVNVADGEIAENSKEAINGGQMFEFKQELDTKANADASNIDIKKWEEALGTGKVEEGNTGLVNGNTMYNVIQNTMNGDIVVPDNTNGTLNIGSNPKYDGINTINIAKSDGTGRVMTGVITDPSDPNSAANVGYVNAIGENIVNGVNDGFRQVNDKVGKVGASAGAMASLPTPPMDGDEKWAFSAGVGHYDGKTAGAIGAFYRPQDNVIVNVRGAVGNGEDMVGAGVGIALNRANTPQVSKAQLVRTINAQAGKIKEQDSVINEQNERIARLESAVAKLVANQAENAK